MIDPVQNYNWRYSEEGNETLTGTVVTIQEWQGRNWTQDGKNSTPAVWDDGNPKLSIRMGLITPEGEFKSFVFPEAGKAQKEGKKPSVHMQMYNLLGGMSKLIGKTLTITTWPSNPQTGQAWGRGNPRLFDIQLVNAGPYQLAQGVVIPEEYKADKLLQSDYRPPVKSAPVMPAMPYQYPTASQPPMAGGFYAPPASAPMPTPMQQYDANLQAARQAQYQSTGLDPVQPAAAPTPQAVQTPPTMDPQVAAAMQNMGAASIYEEDIPF